MLVGPGDYYLRLPHFKNIFRFNGVRMINSVITYQSEFIFRTTIFLNPFVNDPFMAGNYYTGTVVFKVIQFIYFFSNNDRATGCWQHGLPNNFKRPVITTR